MNKMDMSSCHVVLKYLGPLTRESEYFTVCTVQYRYCTEQKNKGKLEGLFKLYVVRASLLYIFRGKKFQMTYAFYRLAIPPAWTGRLEPIKCLRKLAICKLLGQIAILVKEAPRNVHISGSSSRKKVKRRNTYIYSIYA